MDGEQHRAHPLPRDHSIAELLGGDRRGGRRRTRPLPEGAPAGTPQDCARRLTAVRHRVRYVAAVVALTITWLTTTCGLGAALLGNYLLYPYQQRDPARERGFDAVPVWFAVAAVAGPLVIALVAVLGRMRWVAVPYVAAAVLCALLVQGIAEYVGDLAPDKPVPSPTRRAVPAPSRPPHPTGGEHRWLTNGEGGYPDMWTADTPRTPYSPP